jgi:hypothetical protein
MQESNGIGRENRNCLTTKFRTTSGELEIIQNVSSKKILILNIEK